MKLSHGLGMAVGILACFVVGCGDGAPAEPSTEPAQTSAPSTPKAAGPAPLTGQAIEGQKLFEAHCTKCHGDSVGLSAFGTAADVVDYVSENMPRDAPGSLSKSEYFSIVAFDLSANGVDLHGATLDDANADAVGAR